MNEPERRCPYCGAAEDDTARAWCCWERMKAQEAADAPTDPQDPRAALFSLTGLATHLHTSCHAEAARLREIEAAAREWMTVPRRERYADQLDAAHQRLVDALAEVRATGPVEHATVSGVVLRDQTAADLGIGASGDDTYRSGPAAGDDTALGAGRDLTGQDVREAFLTAMKRDPCSLARRHEVVADHLNCIARAAGPRAGADTPTAEARGYGAGWDAGYAAGVANAAPDESADSVPRAPVEALLAALVEIDVWRQTVDLDTALTEVRRHLDDGA